jgi:hypothetical protein
MQLVTYGGRPLALVVNGDLAVFDAELETHGFDDPLLRFVAAMCKLAMELERGLAEGNYDEERAQGYARELLMPEQEFAALGFLPDRYLATCFCVPPEQIPARRRELRLEADPDGPTAALRSAAPD